MLLSSVRIQNFRGIQDASFGQMSPLNVFIGKNNAGKSTIFDALAFLARHMFGVRGLGEWPDQAALRPGNDVSAAFTVELGFTPSEEQRQRYFEVLVALGYANGRRNQVLTSPFFTEVRAKFESSSGAPSSLRLESFSIKGEDGNMFPTINADPARNGSIFADLRHQSRNNPELLLNRDFFSSPPAPQRDKTINLHVDNVPGLFEDPDTWGIGLMSDYFVDFFWLRPHRLSNPEAGPDHRRTMANDGRDLPIVLNYWLGENRNRLEEIEDFVQAALPGIGTLNAGINANRQIEVTFETEDRYRIKLQNMGSGIEQLLMVATVFATQNRPPNIYLEEPENFLHPGAQRYLAEQLRTRAHQSFLTSHSTVFVDTVRATVFRVHRSNKWTEVEPASDAVSLRTLLDDIGARNSDLLMADAIVFVEGISDQEVLTIWSTTQGVDLAAKNIVLAEMGGGRFASRQAPIRSEVLSAISQAAPVPHLFVLDRDERTQEEVAELQDRLRENVHILERRELENYFLQNPFAIRTALLAKHGQDPAYRARLEALSADDIQRNITDAASCLRNTVLAKRLRSVMVAAPGGLIDSETLEREVAQGNQEDLDERLLRAVQTKLDGHLDGIGFHEAIDRERVRLDEEWADMSRRPELVPGADVLRRVYDSVGSNFEKTRDSILIAKAMEADDIPEEIQNLITWISELVEQ